MIAVIRRTIFSTASGRPAVDIGYRIAPEFVLRDFWIGAYWKRIGNCVDLWICVFPCCPIHVSWWWSDPEQ